MADSESFNEEVKAFRKACNDIRLKMPGPDKRHALRVLSDKRIRKQPSETSALQETLIDHLSVEFARPDFKLPSEENPVMEHEWAMIRTLFAVPRLIDPEKVKAHMKGNETMDEEDRLKTRKCLHCGGDLLDEDVSHCSTACLRNASHIIADEIFEEALLAMSRDKVDTKGDEPMDEELFKRVEVNIEKFTRAAMELQVAVIDAEAQLKDARQQRAEAEKMLESARLRWVEAEDTLEKARGRLNHHLDSVRGLNVTVPAPPWEQKFGERDE